MLAIAPLHLIKTNATRFIIGARGAISPCSPFLFRDTPSTADHPELMLRMLIVGYCYGIRFERKLCEEFELHLAYR
jgi:hypothetical protein